MISRTVFLAHAGSDGEFARELADFLEFGCDVTCFTDEGLIEPGRDIIVKAEEGHMADILVLILSCASWPIAYPRQRWEPALFDGDTETVTFLLEDCPYPKVLRRRNFFDATQNRMLAMRGFKRWLWSRNLHAPAFAFDLERLYATLADLGGTMETSGANAVRFASEAAGDFAAVLWVVCRGRTFAQILGDLGTQLGLVLDGTAEENLQRIQALLSGRRCLVVLDSPASDVTAKLSFYGRTSTLITQEPVKFIETPRSLEYARELAASRRYPEAYELFYSLLHAGIATEACARELTWICEHWNRIEEANALRFHYGPSPSEQLALF